jgi:hypothetical protein
MPRAGFPAPALRSGGCRATNIDARDSRARCRGVAIFLGPGKPENCTLKNRYKRGEPVGFRMFVADPSTGNREESAQLVVHLNCSAEGVSPLGKPAPLRTAAHQ